ncbi:MAG: transposase [Proteobacteria bacterium]|nr:transposase [Pseudomonadota bacterium]
MLNIHFHMLFLDGVYVQDDSGHYAFRRTPPPSVEQLHDLLHVISRRVARFLERRGILERDEDNSYLTLDGLEEDPLRDIHSYSVTYRVAIGPQKGRKVFCLQTIPPRSEESPGNARVANLNGFSLHAGVAARAHQRRAAQAHPCARGINASMHKKSLRQCARRKKIPIGDLSSCGET